MDLFLKNKYIQLGYRNYKWKYFDMVWILDFKGIIMFYILCCSWIIINILLFILWIYFLKIEIYNEQIEIIYCFL